MALGKSIQSQREMTSRRSYGCLPSAEQGVGLMDSNQSPDVNSRLSSAPDSRGSLMSIFPSPCFGRPSVETDRQLLGLCQEGQGDGGAHVLGGPGPLAERAWTDNSCSRPESRA